MGASTPQHVKDRIARLWLEGMNSGDIVTALGVTEKTALRYRPLAVKVRKDRARGKALAQLPSQTAGHKSERIGQNTPPAIVAPPP